MQLTQFTDYSLRALIYIGAKQQLCTVSEIALAYTISQHHLVKIIHHLAKTGVIKTIRGKNGGITMAMPPKEINLKNLILRLEPNFDLVPCFNKENPNCCIAPACKLQSILYQAQKAFLDVLAQYTLADIMQNTESLQQLLNIQKPGKI